MVREAEGDLVLIVDNDAAVRDALQFSLELAGLVVRTYGGGNGLLADPELAMAACIILDHSLREMKGFELLGRLRGLDIHVHVILLTSHATAQLRAGAAAAGARLVLEKPCLDNALVSSVLAVLNAT
jgi:FixJ family two-component response regulator